MKRVASLLISFLLGAILCMGAWCMEAQDRIGCEPEVEDTIR